MNLKSSAENTRDMKEELKKMGCLLIFSSANFMTLSTRNISIPIMNILWQAQNLPQYYLAEEKIRRAQYSAWMTWPYLDELREEIQSVKTSMRNRKKILPTFQDKLAAIRIFAPAYERGNFLTESCLSLRRLKTKDYSPWLGFSAAEVLCKHSRGQRSLNRLANRRARRRLHHRQSAFHWQKFSNGRAKIWRWFLYWSVMFAFPMSRKVKVDRQ